MLYFRVACTVSVCAFSWAAAAPSDGPGLIARSIEAERENNRQKVNYIFVEDITKKSFDNEGRQVGQSVASFEVVFIEGRPASRRTSVNGRPLTPEEERAEMARLRQLAQDRKTNPEIRSPAEDRRRSHPYLRFIQYHQFHLTGEEVMDGRPCWVVESKPKGGPKPRDLDDRRIAGASAKFWIDKETLHRVRMDVTTLKPSGGTKVHEFTSYTWGQRDGSVWLITGIHAVLPLRKSTKDLAYFETDQTYSNYRRFTSESSVSAVAELPN